ncbi:histamine N-methyltransferase-like [Xenia sp. Carnegie-2017]|uniref:histamine N-methyltransferase-like n=1 Tax=Xenia sp. Carnegie-2017 TaxID=2897299 RepID=UPI001F036AA1|nr:histamine N-methyltransferase-like [Xenia sp. Carnegie-2017]
MSAKTGALSLEGDYPAYVEEYFNKSTEQEVLTEWALANSSRIVVSDFSSGEYTMLDVCSPDGSTSLKILSIVWRNLQPGTQTTFRVVNNHSAVLEKYQNIVNSSKKREYKKIKFDWRSETLANYFKEMSEKSGGGKMNLAMLIHGMYYLDEPEKDLLHIYENELENNGVILCVIQDENNFALRIQNGLRREGKQFTECVKMISSKEVIAIAKKHEWKHEIDSVEYIVDVSECQQLDSRNGEMLLDMLFNAKNVREKASSDCLQRILTSLKEDAVSNVLKEKLAIILIYK